MKTGNWAKASSKHEEDNYHPGGNTNLTERGR